MTPTVKGREWYQADAVAEAYENKRFSGGGRLIDRREKRAVLEAMAPVEGKRILEIACGTGRFSGARRPGRGPRPTGSTSCAATPPASPSTTAASTR